VVVSGLVDDPPDGNSSSLLAAVGELLVDVAVGTRPRARPGDDRLGPPAAAGRVARVVIFIPHFGLAVRLRSIELESCPTAPGDPGPEVCPSPSARRSGSAPVDTLSEPPLAPRNQEAHHGRNLRGERRRRQKPFPSSCRDSSQRAPFSPPVPQDRRAESLLRGPPTRPRSPKLCCPALETVTPRAGRAPAASSTPALVVRPPDGSATQAGRRAGLDPHAPPTDTPCPPCSSPPPSRAGSRPARATPVARGHRPTSTWRCFDPAAFPGPESCAPGLRPPYFIALGRRAPAPAPIPRRGRRRRSTVASATRRTHQRAAATSRPTNVSTLHATLCLRPRALPALCRSSGTPFRPRACASGGHVWTRPNTAPPA